jgi:hypothetical protein
MRLPLPVPFGGEAVRLDKYAEDRRIPGIFDKIEVTTQPYWAGAFETREVGASFENALRFQNSQKTFLGGRSPRLAETPLRLSS